MSDLSQQKTEPSVIAGNTSVSSDRDSGSKSQGRLNASALHRNHLMPPVRKCKILNIRQQLAQGAYAIDEQLDVAIDRLLERLIG